MVCLNRVFHWCLPARGHEEAIEIEADATHLDILIRQLNLQKAKSQATSGVKSTTSDVGPALPMDKHTVSIGEHAGELPGGEQAQCQVRVQGDCWPDERAT